MSLLIPEGAASASTSSSARYRPELLWDQIVSAEIVSVTSSMRRNQRWSIDRTHRSDSPGPDSMQQQHDHPSSNTGPASRAARDSLHRYDYLADISLRESSGLEYLRMFTDLAANRDPTYHAGPFQTMPESSLLQAFSRLKARLTVIQNLRDLDPLHLLEPFLNVIKSGETNGHITSAALESVEKLINYRVLDPHHPDLPRAVAALADAVTHCRFEGTDIVSDEVVLSRVLRLFRVIVLSDVGKKCLDDKAICAMVEVSFEMLRSFAEETLLVLIQTAFERLVVITREREHRPSLRSQSPFPRNPRNRVVTSGDDVALQFRLTGTDNNSNTGDGLDSSQFSKNGQSSHSILPDDSLSIQPHPFGLPAILEITRVLVSLIDPSNRTQTDSLHRVLGLRLLRRGLEISGRSLGKWIGFGHLAEEKARNAPEKLRKADRLRRASVGVEMKIATDHPAQVVSVHPNGDMLHADGSHRIVDVGSPHLSAQIKDQDIDEVSLGKAFTSDESEMPLLAETIDEDEPSVPVVTETPPEPPVLVEVADASGGIDDTAQKSPFLAQDLHADLQRMAISLKDMITNDLCKYLFLLLSNANVTFTNPPSWQTLSLLTHLLKTVLVLFNTLQEYLFPQQQWLIQYLIQKCYSGIVGWNIEDWAMPSGSFHNYSRPQGDSSPLSGSGRFGNQIIVGEVRELYLETLLQLSRSSSFFVNIYIYYDSDIKSSSHLFEELIGFLSKSSFPDVTPGGPVTSATHQALCFDGLLIFLRRLVDRRNTIGHLPEPITHNSFEPLSTQVDVADPSDNDRVNMSYAPQTLVNNRERKRIMIEGATKFNSSLKEGIKFFQEHGFLPNPLTPIAMAHFFAYTPNLSKAYIGEYFAKPQNVETLGIFVELFDFHGKRIDEAMRLLLEKFRIPGESQQIERVMDAFSKWYFESIKDDSTREIATENDTAVLAFSIIMLNTDQHNPQVKRRMTFHDYSRNVRGLNSGKDFSIDYLKDIYDAIKQTEIVMAEEQGGELSFNFKWRQILAQVPDVVQLSNRNTSIYNKDMFVSVWGPTLAAIFYKDNMSLQKAIAGVQHCAVLASHYGLTNVFDYIIISLLRMTGLNKQSNVLPLEHDINALHMLYDNPAQEASTMSSELDATSFRRYQRLRRPDRCDDDFEIHPDDVVYERMAYECITSCRIEDLIADTRFLEEATLTNLVSTLIDSCYVEPTKFEGAHSALDSTHVAGNGSPAHERGFSQSCVFQLELLLNITLRNRDRIQILWPLITAHLSDVFANASSAPPAFLEHAVSCLLRLLLRLLHVEEIQVEIFALLDKVSKLSVDLLNVMSESLIAGLLAVIMTDISIVAKHQSRWLTVLHVLSATSSHPGAAPFGFEAACLLVSNHPDSPVTADNFGECVDLLISFVTATGPNVANSFENPHPPAPIPISGVPPMGGTLSRTPTRDSKKSPEARSPLISHRADSHRSTQLSPLERALKAVEKLYSLHTKIPKLIEATGIQAQRAWFEFWLPVLSGLGQLCYHPSRDVRQQALTLLQRSLLSPELEESLVSAPTLASVESRIDCFDNVLFPLLDELLKLEVYRIDPRGIEETRVRAVGLLAKIFLRFMPLLSKSNELSRIWVRILHYVCQFLGAGGHQRREVVVEGVHESLKNLLLVLSAEGVLYPPGGNVSTTTNLNLWELTWSTIGQFLPSLQDELFPPNGPEQKPQPPSDSDNSRMVDTIPNIDIVADELIGKNSE
ncbi:hypothetical protein BSLG_007564 [Batrachochytrium salamandrivorans]|nr:hypothetical protein BSLG_007564 [Batrachochytrium salamandrivorans]